MKGANPTTWDSPHKCMQCEKLSTIIGKLVGGQCPIPGRGSGAGPCHWGVSSPIGNVAPFPKMVCPGDKLLHILGDRIHGGSSDAAFGGYHCPIEQHEGTTLVSKHILRTTYHPVLAFEYTNTVILIIVSLILITVIRIHRNHNYGCSFLRTCLCVAYQPSAIVALVVIASHRYQPKVVIVLSRQPLIYLSHSSDGRTNT